MANNVTVNVRRGNLNKALSIFKKEVRNTDIIKEYKEKRYYEKPTTKKRRKKKEAIFNTKKNQRKNF